MKCFSTEIFHNNTTSTKMSLVIFELNFTKNLCFCKRKIASSQGEGRTVGDMEQCHQMTHGWGREPKISQKVSRIVGMALTLGALTTMYVQFFDVNISL